MTVLMQQVLISMFPFAGSHGQAGSAEQRVQREGQGGAPGHRGGHQGQVILACD